MKNKSETNIAGASVASAPQSNCVQAHPSLSAPELKLQKILVPVDFSDCSKKALLYAISFATHFGAELMLLHVIEPYPFVPEMAPYDLEDVSDGREELEALRKSVGQDVPARTSLRTGTPHLEITTAARELGTDLIIISTHGRKGLSRRVFGSTTEKVVRYAPCPVLIVRESEHEFIVSESCSFETATGKLSGTASGTNGQR